MGNQITELGISSYNSGMRSVNEIVEFTKKQYDTKGVKQQSQFLRFYK